MTHYHTLGVTPDATLEQIRASYHRLAKELHPDRLPQASPAIRHDSEERLKAVNDAYHVLSDPVRRTQHDEALGLKFRSRRWEPFTARQSQPGDSPYARATDDPFSLEQSIQKLKEKRRALEETAPPDLPAVRRKFYFGAALTAMGLIWVLSFGARVASASNAVPIVDGSGLIFVALAFFFEVFCITRLTQIGGPGRRRPNVVRQAYWLYLSTVLAWLVTGGLTAPFVSTISPTLCFYTPLAGHFLLCWFIWGNISVRLRRSGERLELLKEQLDYDIGWLEYQLNLRRTGQAASG